MSDEPTRGGVVQCPPDCPVMHNRRHYDDQLAIVQRDVRSLQAQHVEISADMRVLQHVVEEHTRNSVEWHEAHNKSMDQFRADLRAHMDEEPESMAVLLQPVIQRLDATSENIGEIKTNVAGLYARWWTIASALVLLLLAIIGTLYAENQAHVKEVVAKIELERGK